jgi:hypothetical protein
MITGAVHRSPDICLIAQESPENLNQEIVDIGCANGHFLQMRSVGSHSTSGREKEGKI